MNNSIALNIDKENIIETEQDFNITEHPVYKQFTHILDDPTAKEAVKFYERIKNKSFETLKKYEAVVQPKTLGDFFSYMNDPVRVGRHRATLKVLEEREAKYLKQLDAIQNEINTLDDELCSDFAPAVHRDLRKIEKNFYNLIRDAPTEELQLAKFCLLQNVNREEANSHEYIKKMARLTATNRLLLEREYASIDAKVE